MNAKKLLVSFLVRAGHLDGDFASALCWTDKLKTITALFGRFYGGVHGHIYALPHEELDDQVDLEVGRELGHDGVWS